MSPPAVGAAEAVKAEAPSPSGRVANWPNSLEDTPLRSRWKHQLYFERGSSNVTIAIRTTVNLGGTRLEDAATLLVELMRDATRRTVSKDPQRARSHEWREVFHEHRPLDVGRELWWP
jgi:hypothetical protein